MEIQKKEMTTWVLCRWRHSTWTSLSLCRERKRNDTDIGTRSTDEQSDWFQVEGFRWVSVCFFFSKLTEKVTAVQLYIDFLHSWVSMTSPSQLTVGAKVARVAKNFMAGKLKSEWKSIYTKLVQVSQERKDGKLSTYKLFFFCPKWSDHPAYFETTFFFFLSVVESHVRYIYTFWLKEIRWCCCWVESDEYTTIQPTQSLPYKISQPKNRTHKILSQHNKIIYTHTHIRFTQAYVHKIHKKKHL